MKTDLRLLVPDIAALDQAAASILAAFPDQKVFAFHGAMGAGKTTLIRAICRHLGVHGNVSSPTFALVNEYQGAGAEPLYHFDFYRIRNQQEAMDIGCGEYFDSGHYCFIEWPEKILNLLPLNHVPVYIRQQVDEQRLITFYD